MDIQCTHCGKNHNLPDSAVENKRVYFYCSGCGEKITVDTRKTFAESTPKHHEMPGLKDLCDGFTLLFNPAALMISLIFAISSLILIIAGGVIFKSAPQFFFQHIPLAILTGGVLLSLIYFFYEVTLYLLSKIHYYRLNNPDKKKIDWPFILFDFRDDVITLAITSGGLIFALVLILIPASILGRFGLLYSSLIYPVILVLSGLLAVSAIMSNFIPAIVASKSLFVKESVREIFSFIRREIINLPVYFIFVKILTSFVSFILFILFIPAILLSLAGILGFIDMQSKMSIMGIFNKSAGAHGGAAAGTAIIGIFLLLALLILVSALITVSQSFVSKAVHIMNKNPEFSVNRIVTLVVAVIFYLGISFLTLTMNIIPLLAKLR